MMSSRGPATQPHHATALGRPVGGRGAAAAVGRRRWAGSVRQLAHGPVSQFVLLTEHASAYDRAEDMGWEKEGKGWDRGRLGIQRKEHSELAGMDTGGRRGHAARRDLPMTVNSVPAGSGRRRVPWSRVVKQEGVCRGETEHACRVKEQDSVAAGWRQPPSAAPAVRHAGCPVSLATRQQRTVVAARVCSAPSTSCDSPLYRLLCKRQVWRRRQLAQAAANWRCRLVVKHPQSGCCSLRRSPDLSLGATSELEAGLNSTEPPAVMAERCKSAAASFLTLAGTVQGRGDRPGTLLACKPSGRGVALRLSRP